MAKIALGTWAWGAGAFGGDAVFGSKTDVENFHSSTTGISHVKSDVKKSKVYTLQGTLALVGQKGIVIKDGKKVAIN